MRRLLIKAYHNHQRLQQVFPSLNNARRLIKVRVKAILMHCRTIQCQCALVTSSKVKHSPASHPQYETTTVAPSRRNPARHISVNPLSTSSRSP